MEEDVKTDVPKEVGRSKSQNVVLEIVETEKSFIHDLEEVIAGYGNFFNKFQIEHPFQMLSIAIQKLINFSKILLSELEKNQQNLVDFSGIFTAKNMEFYELYGEYCDVYPLTCALLENMDPKSDYGAQINNCKTSIGHALPLSSYLLKPIQRVMKYFLLLSTIESDKSLDQEIKKIINISTEKMKIVADSINERKRIQEGYAQLPILGSKIINLRKPLNYELAGPLVLQDHFKVNNKKRFSILFENVILFTKIVEVDYYSVVDGIPINKVLLLEKMNRDEVSFELKESSKSKIAFVLTPKSKSIKDLWVMHIKRLILKNLNVNFDKSKLSALFGENVGAKINTLITARNLVNIEDLLVKKKASDKNQKRLYKNSQNRDPELSPTKKLTFSNALDNIDMIKKNQKIFDLEALLCSAPTRLPSVISGVIDHNTDSNNSSAYSTISSEGGTHTIISNEGIKNIDLKSNSVIDMQELPESVPLVEGKNDDPYGKDEKLTWDLSEKKENHITLCSKNSILIRNNPKDNNKSWKRRNILDQENVMPLKNIENLNNDKSQNLLNKEKPDPTLNNLPVIEEKIANDITKNLTQGLANFFEMNDKNLKEVPQKNLNETGSKKTLENPQTSLSGSNISPSINTNLVANTIKMWNSNNSSIKLFKPDANEPTGKITPIILPTSKLPKSTIPSIESLSNINNTERISSPEFLNIPISKCSRIGSILMKLQENYSQSQARFNPNPKTIICIGKNGIPIDKLPHSGNPIDQNADDTNDKNN